MSSPLPLSTMLEAINANLHHNPQARSDRSAKVLRINQALSEFSETKPWPFLEKWTDLAITATVEGTVITITLSIVANARLVTASSAVFTSSMEGQTFVLPDGEEHIIAYVADTTNLYLSTSATASHAAATGWSVEFQRYLMPAGCGEIRGAVFTDGVQEQVWLLNQRDVEDLGLDTDIEGRVVGMLEAEPVTDRTPTVAPTLTEGGAASGDLTQGRRYDYCYTIINEGRESAPSPIASVTTVNANTSVIVSAMEDLRFDLNGTPKDSGKRKAVYRRDATTNGPWIRFAVIAAGVTNATDDATLPAIIDEWSDEVMLSDGSSDRRYLRMYQRSAEARTLRVRYKTEPGTMVKDSDIPQYWPDRYHGAFWMRALSLTLAALGDMGQAKYWDKEAQKVIRRAERRFFPEAARNVSAGDWSDRNMHRTEHYINFGKVG